MRWIWIDRFDEFHSGHSARAVKVVSVAESHVHDMYPGFPMMPQSLIIEGMAQTGGILVGEARDFEEKVVLAKIPSVSFDGVAVAGDVLRYDVVLTDLRAEGALCQATVTRNGQPFAKAEIFFAHVDQARGPADAQSPKNFVFTKDHLSSLLRMARGSYEPGLRKVSPPATEEISSERNGVS